MAHIHNSQHNQKKNVQLQTNAVVFYGHPELSSEEKSKFELEKKKFSICSTENGDLLSFQATNLHFSTELHFFSSG